MVRPVVIRNVSGKLGRQYNTTNTMDKLTKIFDEWLMNKDANYNPFTRMFAQIGEDLPQVKLPEMPDINIKEDDQMDGINPHQMSGGE
jgi:hypothetical protein